METIIKLIYWTIMVIVAILFLVNLQNTIRAAAPQNRKIQSRLVWLQLLPLVGLVYSFIVARKVSDTIVAEYRAKGQHLSRSRPTYSVGITMAVFSIIVTGLSVYFGLTYGSVDTSTMAPEEVVAYTTRPDVMVITALMGIASLVWFVFFIIYWVQTAGYKKKMKNLPDQLPDNSIFNHY